MKTRIVLNEMARRNKDFTRTNIQMAAQYNRMSVTEFLRFYIRKWYRTNDTQTTLLAHWAYLRYYLLTF